MHVLAEKIAAFLDQPQGDEVVFNRLALRLFDRQYADNGPYRRLCDAEGKTPETVMQWMDIPAVPALAFKRFDLSCTPVEDVSAVFHSSGTTGEATSRHYLDSDGLALYERSLRQGFQNALPERADKLWALMPPPHEAPNSSLTHMLKTLGANRYFWNADHALHDALGFLSQPVTLFGTAFAFVQFFDDSERSYRLPPGSRIVETGGFKGRTREVPREELYGLFDSRLGVPMTHCHSEYGMCEMASQFYGHGLDPVKRGPHWVRTRAIDPQTGQDAAPGQPGLLRHYDLANINSVMAIQTQDEGTILGDGFALHGRASEAEVRGCSLTVEEQWTRA